MGLGVIVVPELGVTGGAIAFTTSSLAWNTALAVRPRPFGINVTAFSSFLSQHTTGGLRHWQTWTVRSSAGSQQTEICK
jgi:hypothetical protein